MTVLKTNPHYVKENLPDLCASLQNTIIEILLNKLKKLVKATGIKQVGVAGGVSANSGLRQALLDYGEREGLKIFIPKISFTTDNAAMIAITGYYKYQAGLFTTQDVAPLARMDIK